MTSAEFAAVFVFTGLVAIFVATCLLGVQTWTSVVAQIITGGMLLLAAFVWNLTFSSSSVTRLSVDGQPSDIVVREYATLATGPGTVYRQDGLLLTVVGHSLGDNAFRPFYAGAYEAHRDGGVIKVWYSPNHAFSGPPTVSTDRDPDLEIPLQRGLG